MPKPKGIFLLSCGLCAIIVGAWVALPNTIRHTAPAQGAASILASVDILPLVPAVSEISFAGTAGNYNVLSASIVGTGFGANGSAVTARLERSGHDPVVMVMTQVASPTALVGTFDVTAAPAGAWGLTVRNAVGTGVSPSARIFFELPLASSQRIVVSGVKRETVSAATEASATVASGGGGGLRIITPSGFVSAAGASPVFDLHAFSSGNDFIGMGRPIAPSTAIASGSAVLAGDVYSIDLRREDVSIQVLSKPVQLAFSYPQGAIDAVFPAWYDESTGIWRIMDGRSLDAAAHTIFVDTSHFSVFSLVRDASSPSQVSAGGSSGSGFSMATASSAVATRAILPSTVVVPSGTQQSRARVAYGAIPRVTLSFGSRGASVRQLQSLLIAYAPDLGPAARRLAATGATGYFGTATRAAVAELQLFLARGKSVPARALTIALARKEGVGNFGRLTRAAAEEFFRE